MANVTRNQTVPVIATHFASASAVTIAATLVDKSKMSFDAKIVYTDGADTVTATVCSPNGKTKVFGNLDDLVNEFSKAAPGVSTVNLTMNVDMLSPDRISLDPAKQLAADKVRNKAALDRQTALVTKLDAVLTGISSYQTGNSLQQAAYTKAAAQRAVANELKVYYASLPQP